MILLVLGGIESATPHRVKPGPFLRLSGDPFRHVNDAIDNGVGITRAAPVLLLMQRGVLSPGRGDG